MAMRKSLRRSYRSYSEYCLYCFLRNWSAHKILSPSNRSSSCGSLCVRTRLTHTHAHTLASDLTHYIYTWPSSRDIMCPFSSPPMKLTLRINMTIARLKRKGCGCRMVVKGRGGRTTCLTRIGETERFTSDRSFQQDTIPSPFRWTDCASNPSALRLCVKRDRWSTWSIEMQRDNVPTINRSKNFKLTQFEAL